MSNTESSDGSVIDMSQFPALLGTNPTFVLKNAQDMKIEQPVTARYTPQPDITAYELALILPGLLGKPIFEADWTKLGSASRHFERVKLT